MNKKLNKIIEIPCEESSKKDIEVRIRDYLGNNQDYIDGNILVNSDRFECVDVIIFDGCSNIPELTMVLTM